MNNPDISERIHDEMNKIDLCCNNIINSSKHLIGWLDQLENEDNIKLSKPYQNLRKNLTNVIDEYQVEEK